MLADQQHRAEAMMSLSKLSYKNDLGPPFGARSFGCLLQGKPLNVMSSPREKPPGKELRSLTTPAGDLGLSMVKRMNMGGAPGESFGDQSPANGLK